jgi:hypothetical protein
MAYDEDLMYDEFPVSIALYPEQGILSSLDPMTHKIVSVIAALSVIGLFLGVTYKFILPAHVKTQVFGGATGCSQVELEFAGESQKSV